MQKVRKFMCRHVFRGLENGQIVQERAKRERKVNEARTKNIKIETTKLRNCCYRAV